MPTPVVLLPDHLRTEIVDHCMRELPNEACGLLAFDGDDVMKVYPTPNADASPTSFTVPPHEHYRALVDAETHGWEIGGVFHSHPGGPPTLSEIDRERALEPGWWYLVVGMAGAEPRLAFHRVGR